MSVIIRLQNLPWSANALDIRTFFRGLSIPEGGVHIVGGELGDAFIAFSTDEDARQAMMLDGGKVKEIQVKLYLSSRSEMHKVIETARQTVPILTLTAPAPAPAPAPTPAPIPTPAPNPFAAVLGANNPLASLGIPGLGNPLEIPQPAVIEPPIPISISPPIITTPAEKDDDDRIGQVDPNKKRDRRRSRSRSRSREKKDRKRDRRDRSRSREGRRRRDRSRSRDRRDRKRDRKDRSRSRERSPSRHSRDRREERRSPNSQQENRASRNVSVTQEQPPAPAPPPPPIFTDNRPVRPDFPMPMILPNNNMAKPKSNIGNGQNNTNLPEPVRLDPVMAETYNRLQELGKKRNPNAFQGDQNGGPGLGGRFNNGPGGMASRGGRRENGRPSRFDRENDRDCCVAIRNAPNHTSYGDVRRFFPFMIDKHGIKMINDNMGRRTGNIFVRFCEARSKQLSLQRRNNELKGQEVIVENLDDEAYEAAIDSFMPFRDEREEVQVPQPEPEPEPEPYTVLRLSDLPNYVKEHDIIKAFSDYSLLSMMLNDCRKTRTRTAHVQFVKAEDARKAFARREQYVFGRRQATVEPMTAEEYDKEKSTQNALVQPPPIQVEASPSPEPVVPRDPRQRREPPAPQTNCFAPTFVAPQPTFPQPFANQFPGFVPPIDPRANVDPRGPPVWGVRAGFPQNETPHRQPMEDEPLDCVLMKGLPMEATDRTIVEFLSETGAVPARIHLMLDPNGMPSGDCFCEFRSVSEARRAVSKHGHDLDGCRISVDLVGRGVVEEALEGPKIIEQRAERALLGEPPLMQPFFDNPHGGFHDRGGFRGRGNFERGFDRGFDRGGGGGFRGRGGFDRGRGGFDRGGRGGFDRGGRGGFDRGGRGGFGGRGTRRGFDDRDDMGREEGDPALQDFGAPGCVVSMENVPFRATVEDILRFFGDFNLTQDDVIRRFNEKGQPTGDARVAFESPYIAQKAAKNHNFETILERRITLSLL